MKNLIEISKIVTKKKVKKIEIFDEQTLRHKSKFSDFYEALMSSKFKNDRDAAQHLYQCGPTDDRYRQLKSRFRKRLLNTLFFLDVNSPGTSNYNQAYYTVNREWTLVKILMSQDAPYTAAQMAKQILGIALKFKFADVIVNCARILREYCVLINEEKEYELYDQYAKQFKDVLEAEIRSEEFYHRVLLNYHKPQMKSSELKERIDTYCDALVGLSEMYDSPIIMYNMFMVWAYRYEMLNDYAAMLEVCAQAQRYISDNPIFYRDDLTADFQMKEMLAYLHLRDFRNGKIGAERALKSFPEGSDHWYQLMERYYLLSMHTAQYANALAVFNEATNQSRFKKLPASDRDRWAVYEVYVNLVLETEAEQNPVLRGQETKNFKVARFLNEQLTYPKEQRVYQFLMLIAQTVLLIERRSFNAAHERIERLKMLSMRQLKKEDNFRLLQFIRLLQQAARVNFKLDNLNQDSKYHDRLTGTPFKYRGLLDELEIIPFETLWGTVVSRLKR